MTIATDGTRYPLHATVRSAGRLGVVDLSGECDIATEHRLRDAIAEALSASTDMVIFDLKDLAFCDSAGVLRILRAARARHVVVSGAGGCVERIFELLDPLGDVARYPTLDLATRATAGQR